MNSLDICNGALDKISVQSIAALTESSKAAETCNRLYDKTRKSVLEDHAWNFATRRVTLAVVAGESFNDWTYIYAYPSDCIRVIRIHNPAGDVITSTTTVYDAETESYVAKGQIEFEILINSDKDQKMICTDQAEAELVYVADVELVNLFSSQFITALECALASELAIPLRQDRSLKQDLKDEYAVLIGSAKAGNANEDYKVPASSSSLLDARG
jgi:hypothetical protein